MGSDEKISISTSESGITQRPAKDPVDPESVGRSENVERSDATTWKRSSETERWRHVPSAPSFPKLAHFFKIVEFFSIFSQALLVIFLVIMSQEIIEYRSILGLPLILLISFSCCSFLIFFNCYVKFQEFFSEKLAKYHGTINLLATIAIFGLGIVLNLKFLSIDEDSFRKNFLNRLKIDISSSEIHRFQQEYKCCGVGLDEKETFWNESTLPFSNPWSSWFYHFVPGEDYSYEARRLFSLPWSCCKSSTNCDHLAIERFTLKFTEPDQGHQQGHQVDEEVEYIDKLLGTRSQAEVMAALFTAPCHKKAAEIVEKSRDILATLLFGIGGAMTLKLVATIFLYFYG